MITSAFTCTGPYAILILLGIKRVENRVSAEAKPSCRRQALARCAMPVPAKGRCAISCSKSFCREEYGEFVRWASRTLKPEEFETIPAWDEVKDWPGKVVGCCDYEAGTARPEFAPCQGMLLPAPVAEGRDGTVERDEGYGCWWKLSEIVSFDKPIPCRGNVGMWQMPPALAAQVSAADMLARAVGERIATAVRPDEVFGAALKADAKAIVVAHNHPSGNITPSVQDCELTAALKRLGDLLGVMVLDHLIVTNDAFAVIEPNDFSQRLKINN